MAGYHTEYGSMRFATYFMAEYMSMATISGMMATLFFGGWHLPWVTDATLLSLLGDSRNLLALLQVMVFFSKIAVFLLIFVWVRWTVPRFRFDQLMRLAWRTLIPLAIFNLVLTALVMYWRERERMFFIVFGLFSILRAVSVVFSRNRSTAPSASSSPFSASPGFTSSGAPTFMAMIQILIYTGAIVVLFVFVVMLLNLGKGSGASRRVDDGLVAERQGSGSSRSFCCVL